MYGRRSCAQQARAEETTHSTTHVKNKKIKINK